MEELSKRPGLLGEIFERAKPDIQNPAILRRLIVDLIDAEQWSKVDANGLSNELGVGDLCAQRTHCDLAGSSQGVPVARIDVVPLNFSDDSVRLLSRPIPAPK